MSKRATLISAVMAAAVVAAIFGATAALMLIGGAFGPGGQAAERVRCQEGAQRGAAHADGNSQPARAEPVPVAASSHDRRSEEGHLLVGRRLGARLLRLR